MGCARKTVAVANSTANRKLYLMLISGVVHFHLHLYGNGSKHTPHVQPDCSGTITIFLVSLWHCALRMVCMESPVGPVASTPENCPRSALMTNAAPPTPKSNSAGTDRLCPSSHLNPTSRSETVPAVNAATSASPCPDKASAGPLAKRPM